MFRVIWQFFELFYLLFGTFWPEPFFIFSFLPVAKPLVLERPELLLWWWWGDRIELYIS